MPLEMMKLFLINMMMLTNPQKVYIAVAVAAAVLLIVVTLIFLYKRVYCKKRFKESVYLKLSILARDNDFLLLNNYKVDFDDNHVGVIDHLLISKKYIFAINDFPISGVIKGELKGRTLAIIKGEKNIASINNPLNYNINLIKRFNLFNNIDQSFVKGIVVVDDDTKIEIENQSQQFLMIQKKKLKKTILNFDKSNEKNLKEDSIIRFINKLDRENNGKTSRT